MMKVASVLVSDACQINDLDHLSPGARYVPSVSDACQINDLDHVHAHDSVGRGVSDACQINDLDHLESGTFPIE